MQTGISKVRLPPLPNIGDILRMYGLRARKSLSQNFILDPRILDKFARTAGVEGKHVVEVGPGPGGITRACIVHGAKKVHVIEKDKRFLPSLNMLQEATGETLHINIGDCLHYNMSKIFPDTLRREWEHPEPPDIVLVGNLPFNISTPLVIKYLRDMYDRKNLFSYGRVPLLLTFQEEVAQRLIAHTSHVERSRLSVLAQCFAQVRYKQKLKSGAFIPPPKVEVGIVHMLPLRTPYIELPFVFIERVVTGLFNGKRKTIPNGLKKLFPDDIHRRERVEFLLDITKIPRLRKVIELDMDDMAKICYGYHDICEKEADVKKYFEEVLPLSLMDQTNEIMAELFDDSQKPLKLNSNLSVKQKSRSVAPSE